MSIWWGALTECQFWVGTHQRQGKTSEKSEEKERDRGTEGETPNPIPAIDELIGNEEQNVKQKRTKREKQSCSPTQLPWTIQSPPTTRRDHTDLYDKIILIKR